LLHSIKIKSFNFFRAINANATGDIQPVSMSAVVNDNGTNNDNGKYKQQTYEVILKCV